MRRRDPWGGDGVRGPEGESECSAGCSRDGGGNAVAELDVTLPDPSHRSPRDTELMREMLKSLRFPRFSLDWVRVCRPASAPHGKGFPADGSWTGSSHLVISEI